MKISLRRRHAPRVGNGACSHKIDYITNFAEEKKIIFPIGQSGEASRWRVRYQWDLTRLVI